MNEAGRLRQLLQQSLDMRGVIDVLVGQVKCNDLPAVGDNANMKLSPSAAFGRPGFSNNHSPAPRNFSPVLSTIK